LEILEIEIVVGDDWRIVLKFTAKLVESCWAACNSMLSPSAWGLSQTSADCGLDDSSAFVEGDWRWKAEEAGRDATDRGRRW